MIDMWYSDSPQDADEIDVFYYPGDAEYRGNIWKDGKAIGDYSCKDSAELESIFPQLHFNWD